MFSRYNTINTILIESVYPFTYVIIMMICNSSYLRYCVSFILSKIIFARKPDSASLKQTMKVIHLLCTYSSDVDISQSMSNIWLAKAVVLKFICQVNYYYFTRITRRNITMLLSLHNSSSNASDI